jgi:hypothetical protein
MNYNVAFQIVCIDCGCLAVRIEDPVKASRETIVHCGDCGASRGTVGALRDLAVQPDSAVILPTKPAASHGIASTEIDPQSGTEISRRYDELQRLRRQVEIAESYTRDRHAQPTAIVRTRGKKATVVP